MSALDDEDGQTLPAPADLAAELTELSTNSDDNAVRDRVRVVVHDIVAADLSDEDDERYRAAIVSATTMTVSIYRAIVRDARKARKERQATAAPPAARHRAEPPSEAAARYQARTSGLWALSLSDEWTHVSTFVPRVIESVRRDDGSGPAGITLAYRIWVALPDGSGGEADVPGDRLGDVVDWATRAAGHRAVVLAVPAAKDHVRVAAQLLASPDVADRTVYCHTGWRTINGRQRYLTASGALGAVGLDETITVELPGPLAGVALPDAAKAGPDELRDAVRASLTILDIAPAAVIAPALGAALRAPLPLVPDGGVWIDGRTGAGKSQIAALCMQHFGPALDAKHLPGEFSSTANALAEKAYLLANVLFVVDDYIPTGGAQDVARMQKAADHLVRGSANGSGRDRLDSTATLRVSRPPRAQVLVTGEDLPPGHSLRGRLHIAELGRDDLNWAKLTVCQEHARDGVYALAMAGFVRWLAVRMDADPGYADKVAAARLLLRTKATVDGQHRRTPDMIASLALGWEAWLAYAVEIQAISPERRDVLWQKVWAGLTAGADVQAEAQRDADPVRVYLASLAAAIVGGHAHLTDLDGWCPTNRAAWGWAPAPSGGADVIPRGDRIGWVDGDLVYLDPGAAYLVAVRHGRASSMPPLSGDRTIRKRLYEAGQLAEKSTTKRKDGTEVTRYTVRRTVDGGRRTEVLCLPATALLGEPDNAEQQPAGSLEAASSRSRP